MNAKHPDLCSPLTAGGSTSAPILSLASNALSLLLQMGRGPSPASPSCVSFQKATRADIPLRLLPCLKDLTLPAKPFASFFSWKMKLSAPFPLSLHDSISPFFLGSSYMVHIRSPLSSSVTLIFFLLNFFSKKC